MRKTMAAFYLKICLILIGIMGSKITFPVLLISYVALGYSTNTELVFYVIGLFKELRHSVGITIPLGLTHLAEFNASLTRVSRMLHIQEHYNYSSSSFKTKTKVELKEVMVLVEKETILNNVSFSITEPGLIVITGLVGSGKSSLLKTILKDYANTKGQVIVCGSVSYASQDPWLFPASIKQNIIFGQNFDQLRYDQVVQVCSLQYDFNLLTNGDETVVTDGGMNLSKGQQARINLARAIYKNSDIYLLDDSLAALDVKVQEDIFTQCIRNYLKDKIVLFVTQNPVHFKAASTVIYLNRGAVKSISKSAEVLNELKTPFTAQEVNEKQLLEMIELDEKVKQNIYHEDKKIGSVDFATYLKYFKFGGGLMIFALILAILLSAQFTESYSSKLVSRW